MGDDMRRRFLEEGGTDMMDGVAWLYDCDPTCSAVCCTDCLYNARLLILELLQ